MWWHRILRLFLKLCPHTRILPMGFTMVPGSKMVLFIDPMRILVRLVLNWKFWETISRFCTPLSVIGCIFHKKKASQSVENTTVIPKKKEKMHQYHQLMQYVILMPFHFSSKYTNPISRAMCSANRSPRLWLKKNKQGIRVTNSLVSIPQGLSLEGGGYGPWNMRPIYDWRGGIYEWVL